MKRLDGTRARVRLCVLCKHLEINSFWLDLAGLFYWICYSFHRLCVFSYFLLLFEINVDSFQCVLFSAHRHHRQQLLHYYYYCYNDNISSYKYLLGAWKAKSRRRRRRGKQIVFSIQTPIFLKTLSAHSREWLCQYVCYSSHGQIDWEWEKQRRKRMNAKRYGFACRLCDWKLRFWSRRWECVVVVAVEKNLLSPHAYL